MTWIKTWAPEEASGLLQRLYEAAIRRAGKVYNVVRAQSLRPETLRSSTALYVEIMKSERSPLSRRQREMLATVVSWANDCEY